jgi:hypothetical protein
MFSLFNLFCGNSVMHYNCTMYICLQILFICTFEKFIANLNLDFIYWFPPLSQQKKFVLHSKKRLVAFRGWGRENRKPFLQCKEYCHVSLVYISELSMLGVQQLVPATQARSTVTTADLSLFPLYLWPSPPPPRGSDSPPP